MIVIYFSGILFYLKTHGKYLGLIPFLLAFLLSIPWSSQELNHTLLTLLPVSYAFLTFLIPEREVRNHNYSTLFKIGAGIMIAILFSYKILLMLIGVFVTYLLLRTPRLSEVVALIGGLLSVMIIFMLIMYFNENLDEYWDQGVLYFSDNVRLSNVSGTTSNASTNIYTIIWNWGGWILLSIIGIIHYRIRFYSYIVKIRLAERIMSVWLFFGTISILIKQENIIIQDFLLIAPPLSFYAIKALELIKKRRLQSLLVLISFVPAFISFIHFWRPLEYLTQESFFNKILTSSPIELNDQKSQVYQQFSSINHLENIWILADWPDMYHRLNASCANKYVDFSMTYYKLPLSNERYSLRSKEEPDREVFIQLRHQPPTWVIDPQDLFQSIQARYPSVLGNYQQVDSHGILIYRRKE